MGHGPKVTLILVSIFLIQLYCTWGSEIFKHYYTSTYNALCYDACKSHTYNYYWCHTREGWDYCSLLQNLDYEGYECRDEHPCGKHGESYYWCRRKSGDWGYCGKVEPKTMLHLSSTYQSVCIDACLYDSYKNYHWCYTEEGWDYCSPLPGVTYKNEPCLSYHPCGTHGHTYTWCKTESDWDYCGLIEISGTFTITKRQKRHPNNTTEICTETDIGNKKQTKIYTEPNPTTIADVGRHRNEITDLISRWNNSYLGNQAKSGLITSEHLRIDLQGIEKRNNQPYYNLQIQINTPRRPGTSTTVAQVLLPQNEDVPDRYIQRAFTESFRRLTRVFMDVNHGNFSVTPGQNCG